MIVLYLLSAFNEVRPFAYLSDDSLSFVKILAILLLRKRQADTGAVRNVHLSGMAECESEWPDAEVIRYGSVMVLGSLAGGPFQGVLQLSIVYLQGTGNVSAATGFAVFRQIAHHLLLVGMNVLFGFMGLVFSSSATTILCAATGVLLCRRQIVNARTNMTNQQTG